MNAQAASGTHEFVETEVGHLDRLIEALLRAWISADDEKIEIARHRVERVMVESQTTDREACEAVLGRLERAQLQARLRNRQRR